jgi:hypothetical protein
MAARPMTRPPTEAASSSRQLGRLLCISVLVHPNSRRREKSIAPKTPSAAAAPTPTEETPMIMPHMNGSQKPPEIASISFLVSSRA